MSLSDYANKNDTNIKSSPVKISANREKKKSGRKSILSKFIDLEAIA